jgi:uncharacterized protein
MKIVLAGGSGYLGNVLSAFYQDKATEIVILSRQAEKRSSPVRIVTWDARTLGGWIDAIEGADLLINLTGKNVNCRYTKKNRNEILRSRIDATLVLGEAVTALNSPPPVWIQSSSATIYRDSHEMLMTERNGVIGTGFSENVCVEWERAFEALRLPETRKICLRTGIVLGRSDGAMPRLMNLVKFGLGGQQGNGQQFVSWIHERDFIDAVEWLRTQPNESGIYNCTAPQPVTNAEFMRALRSEINAPFGLPTPAAALSVGALIIGTEPELVLKSRKVYPQRLLDNGFVFEFPDLKSALVDLCQRAKRS